MVHDVNALKVIFLLLTLYRGAILQFRQLDENGLSCRDTRFKFLGTSAEDDKPDIIRLYIHSFRLNRMKKKYLLMPLYLLSCIFLLSYYMWSFCCYSFEKLNQFFVMKQKVVFSNIGPIWKCHSTFWIIWVCTYKINYECNGLHSLFDFCVNLMISYNVIKSWEYSKCFI